MTCPSGRYKDGRCKDDVRRRQRLYHRRHYKSARKMILAALGGKCSRCGFDDERALQIDHKRGGGNRMRRELQGSRYYPAILSQLHKGGYQLLCANCNAIKKAERREKTRRKK